MPPNPLYGWACVAHSIAEILSHAAEIRARQAAVARTTASSRFRTNNEAVTKPDSFSTSKVPTREATVSESPKCAGRKGNIEPTIDAPNLVESLQRGVSSQRRLERESKQPTSGQGTELVSGGTYRRTVNFLFSAT